MHFKVMSKTKRKKRYLGRPSFEVRLTPPFFFWQIFEKFSDYGLEYFFQKSPCLHRGLLQYCSTFLFEYCNTLVKGTAVL